MKRLVLLAAVLWPLTAPQTALAPTATVDHWLHTWQAVRVARSNADLQDRERYKVLRTRRLGAYRIRVFWRDDPYLDDCGDVIPAAECFDFGSDVVELRRRQWWIEDGSVLDGVWRRWL